MVKLVARSVADARAGEDATAGAARQQWEAAQGVYGNLGVAALDRWTGWMTRGVDSARRYLTAASTGLVLGRMRSQWQARHHRIKDARWS